MKKIIHIHKYKKINIGIDKKYYVYKCQKPGCDHYIPISLSEGAICECNRCGDMMTIGKYQLHGNHNKPLTRPHCEKCIRGRKFADVNIISSFLLKD